MRSVIKIFDRFEDRVRGRLSKTPIIYAFIAGIAIVLFWRGVWDTADLVAYQYDGIWSFIFYPPVELILSTIVLLATGLFFSFFVGDRLVISGLQHEKKIEEKTADEIKAEDSKIHTLQEKIFQISKDVEEIKNILQKKQ
jgi:hypothetical protein